MEQLKQFWEIKSNEERRKIIVYAIASLLAVFLLVGVYVLNSGDEKVAVDEISNPDAKEAQKYNSRTEANQLGKKDSSKLNTAMDDLFGKSGDSQIEIIDVENLMHVLKGEPYELYKRKIKNFTFRF